MRANVWKLGWQWILPQSLTAHPLQSVIKLYVIFNVLEIFDKLCTAFGLVRTAHEYASTYVWSPGSCWLCGFAWSFLDHYSLLFPFSQCCLLHHFHDTRLQCRFFVGSLSPREPLSKPLPPRLCHRSSRQDIFMALRHAFGASRRFRVVMHFCVALIYLVVHSAIIIYQLITLSVAVNSHGSILLTVVISNQFMELKVGGIILPNSSLLLVLCTHRRCRDRAAC